MNEVDRFNDMGEAESDAQLTDKLRRNGGLLLAEQVRAKRSYEAATMACGAGPLPTIRDIWRAAQHATAVAAANARHSGPMVGSDARLRADVAQLRIATEAADVLAAFAAFTPDQVRALADPHSHNLAHTPAARALLVSKPATARWLALRDAEAARIDASRAAELAQLRVHLPANLVRALRDRGMTVELTRGGKIEIGGEVSRAHASELEGLREWRDEVVAFLKGEREAEARTPVLVI